MTNPTEQAQQLFLEGSGLLRKGNSAAALVYFQQANNLAPSNPVILLHEGTALHNLERYEEAIACYHAAIRVAPRLGEVHNNLGNSLMALGRFADAADSFAQAAQFLPLSPVPLAARATALQALGFITEAETDCRNALLIAPGFAEAHWNLALNLLLQGRYPEGWSEYEWRWQKPDFTSPCRHTDIPFWDGSPLHGRTILLHAEQGFGDAIQFVRYAPLVASCGGNIVLECHPQLVSLFQGIKGISSVVAFGEQVPACDFQAPFLTLPRIFRTTLENIPAGVYLPAPAERLEKWHQLTSFYSGPKVGIVWAGSSIHRNDNYRSMPLAFLSSLAKFTGINFFSLQLGDAKHQLGLSPLAEQVVDLTDQICDFADTTALIEQLDLVLSVDTAVAHLAGTLGKPVHLMISFAPDWRWLLERNDSPWYPTMRIYRQKQPGDWGEVINRIHSALDNLTCNNKKSFEVAPKD